MAKKGAVDNPKKSARQAQSASAAEEKERKQAAALEGEVDENWSTGKKKAGKKEEQAEKRAEALLKKAQRDEMLREEEKSISAGLGEPKKFKKPAKKPKGPDLSQLEGDNDDDDGGRALRTLNASGIDNALDALELDGPSGTAAKVEKHPERRFQAALARYEEMRLEEMKADGTGDGLRMNQRRLKIKKEFERHEDNPFNQLTAEYNATRDDMGRIRGDNAAKVESRLAAQEEGEE